MARWQLQCSGKAEEDHCKFCQSQLPDWRDALFKDVICDETPSSSRLSSPSPTPAESSEGSRGDEAQDSDGSGSDGSADADGAAMPARSSTPSPDALGRAPAAGAPKGGVSRSSDRPPLCPPARASVDAPPGSPAGDPAPPALGDVKGDIIVKFNDMSFRCKVRTGQEGLEDFMAQIREKCGIPEEKMRCLNLTYRCKDPNTGSQMTLQGVNESAFDAAVLCSAAQDKIKQRRRASRDGGRREAEARRALPRREERVPSAANEETDARLVATRERAAPRSDGGVPCPGSPGKSGRREYRGCDAASTRTRRRRNSLDESQPVVAADAEDPMANGRNEGSRARDASETAAPETSSAPGGFAAARGVSARRRRAHPGSGARAFRFRVRARGGRRADGPAPRAPAVAELHERLDQERGVTSAEASTRFLFRAHRDPRHALVGFATVSRTKVCYT